MNDEQREQVRNNARYLQNVRPIDPEEIYEYVEGQPHPAVVRQVLREQAFDLGLIERDEAFVPVSDSPVEIEFDGVDRIPLSHVERLETLLVERYGEQWETGESGDRLRENIRQFKAEYFDQRSVEYDAETALAYAIYHLPDNYAVAQHAFADLAREDCIPHQLRLLDVGAGVGGPALGILDLLSDVCLIDYHAVEPSAAADVFDALVEPGCNQSVTLHRQTAEAFEPDDEYDLVLFANVLSELDDPVPTVERYLSSLATDGTCLMLAPADENTATGLRAIERELVDEQDYTVYAPTVRLWPDRTPESTVQGWSFDVKPDIETPTFQRRLAQAATETATAQDTDSTDETEPETEQRPEEFINVDVQYAYSVLRRDGRQRIEFTPDPSRFAPMAESESHVSDRINLVGIKLSHDIGSANPLFEVGDGSETVDHYAVLANETGLNRDLPQAEYGTLLAFENVLVLWNDDEQAYNLVVDEETIVDRISTVS
ncbi:small ribosomal subunit Rsm22 family protein [Halocatena marina]|uniref:small ribosomal subunit Rsm22 family protein n=1 Tax=Halocatena marina TaxID=2934937 RepID=UPI00200BD241|nr:methyltransferase domain-containing protein [Halocatena marina]